MENNLYLLELFVETITFSSNLPDFPRAHEVKISGDMGKFIQLEVHSVQPSVAIHEHKKEINLNCGQSALFSCTPDELLQKINEYPFELHLCVRGKHVATAAVGWTRDFYTLAKKNGGENGGPVVMKDQFLFQEMETARILGDIIATVKLTCFGSNIQTSFQVISATKDVNKRFLVKGARGESTFECQKIGAGHSGEIIPFTTLFTSVNNRKRSDETVDDDDDHLSFMALFKSTMEQKYSTTPDEFNVTISSMVTKKTLSNLTFDIVSLMERPVEDKCFDLRIRGNSQGFTFEFENPAEVHKRETCESLIKETEELTAEKINRMLCKNKDCPAVKKFKDFGIGPLANTKGLGAVYGETSLPLTYGLSQTYGVFDEYGPYGLFSRPKRPSNPFVPKQENNWTASCWKPKRQKHDDENTKRACKKHNCNACYCQDCSPLRLTGGGVIDYDDIKSPFHECQELMHQMDEVVRRFKKSLGPCGKTTCPFAPNITKESCKKMCNHEMDVYSEDIPLYKEEPKACSAPKTTPTRIQSKAACGLPKCAYAKYKTGLVDEDVEMDLQYLPPAPSGKCGHPKCPYPVEPDLPPIHWDCPEPLPEGRCKNPNCPYLPQEIKCLNAVLAKGPCDNYNCPYSPPPPCESPYCPFGNKECPYQEKPKDDESACYNPECPYIPKETNQCPGGVPFCATNPYMLNLLTYLAILSGNPNLVQMCFGGPDCPYVKPIDCSSPRCPYKNKSVEKKSSPCYVPVETECGNPSCPYEKEDKTDLGTDVDCKSDTRLSMDLQPCCGNNCKSQGGNLSCEECSGPKQSQTCDTPICPNVSEACYTKPTKKDEVCENPECPYTPKTVPNEICDNINCPYSPNPVPPCSIRIDPLQALLSSCLPLSICPDATCPNPLANLLQICFGGQNCPLLKPQSCKIEEKGDICGNTECPYADTAKTKKFDPFAEEQIVVTEDSPTEYKSDTRLSRDLAPCTQKTCHSVGGKRDCEDCPCMKSKSETSPSKKKKFKVDGGSKSNPVFAKDKERRTKSKYVYSVGDKYPGVQIGHKECVMPGFNVPSKMGWLWNIHTPCMQLKPRRGWRPGAIAKTIAARIRKHRESQGLKMMELKNLRKGKRGYGQYDSGTSINIQPKPTLHIKKHQGAYWITMNPLKDPHTLVENESPYMDCTPLQFKIVKNKNNEKDENDEYKSCFCGDEEKAEESSSSESELEIEFTPPAGIIHPERFKKKKNVVHCDTQYLTQDFDTKSEAKTDKTKKSAKGKGKGKGKKGKGKKK